jgi:dethiobiotin synthetase
MDVADLALQLELPVLLVVGLRLGCLNHARLTEKAILSSGAPYLGWIGSVVDPNMLALDQNIATLEEKLEGACLGVLSNGASEIRFRQGVDITMWCS